MALYDAIDGFCPDQGYKFLTYAKPWIMQRMKRYIDNCCHVVRIPAYRREQLQEYRKMINAFQVYLGRLPTRREIARDLHLDGQQMDDLEAAARMAQIGSLDSYITDDDDSVAVGDMVPCDVDVEGSVLDDIEGQQLKGVLWGMVDALQGGQSAVIHARYQRQMTAVQAGEFLGISETQVRNLEKGGLRELYRKRHRLQPLLPERLGSLAYHGGVEDFKRTWASSTERAAMRL